LDNQTQHEFYDWAASSQDQCGASVEVAPEHDVNMCDGRLVESANDADNQTILAMYPRQPFNFAGRTGTVEFDVSDNTVGGHGAWPSLVITDQPVPAPYNDTLSAVSDQARNSVGINFDSLEDENPGCLTANVWETVDYQTVIPATHIDGCVATPAGPSVMNHVEVQINSAGVKVYMSPPGDPASTRLIADSEFTVPLSQGLVWLEDVHYNGNKFCASAGQCQQTNTFAWSDLAFDGPVEARDLGFDVLDNTAAGGTAPNGLPMTSLGYPIYGSGRGPASLTVHTATGPTSADISNAIGAIFTLSYYPLTAQTLTYSVNGNPALQFDWPYASKGTYASESVALPVPLSDVIAGTNTITLSTSDTSNGVDLANMDLILQGAGGVVPPTTGGYWLVAGDGGVFSFHAPFYGSTGNVHLNQPIVGMATTPDGQGYWMVARDGGVFSFGDARFHGSTGNIRLNEPIVGMATDPATGGYWLVAADGGIFSFGAPFYGSTGGVHLNQPIVGMATTPDGQGYWLVARDGGVFSFGDARFYGSTGDVDLNQPIVGMGATRDGQGYWLVASDGGIFSFGDARFDGSTGSVRLNQPMVGMATDPATGGYWLVASDGGIFSFDAPFYGSTGNVHLNQPIVGVGAP
jgi:hypothetical protein